MARRRKRGGERERDEKLKHGRETGNGRDKMECGTATRKETAFGEKKEVYLCHASRENRESRVPTGRNGKVERKLQNVME
jgi:hypothetical protein